MKKHLRNGKKRMLQVALHDRQARSCVVVSPRVGSALWAWALFPTTSMTFSMTYCTAKALSTVLTPPRYLQAHSIVPSKLYLTWRFPRFSIDAIAARTIPFPFPRGRNIFSIFPQKFMHNDKHSGAALALERLPVCPSSHFWEPACE